jgi:hypothetical protein
MGQVSQMEPVSGYTHCTEFGFPFEPDLLPTLLQNWVALSSSIFISEG